MSTMERTQKDIAIGVLVNVLSEIARGCLELDVEFDPWESYDGSRAIMRVSESVCDALDRLGPTLNELDNEADMERVRLLGRITQEDWPGLSTVMSTEATFHVPTSKGWLLSLEDGPMFWFDRQDALETARDTMVLRIAEMGGLRPSHPNDPDQPVLPHVSDRSAMAWLMDGAVCGLDDED